MTQSSQGLGTRGDRGRLEGEKDSAQRDVKHPTDRPREVDLLRDLVHGSEIVDAENRKSREPNVSKCKFSSARTFKERTDSSTKTS